MRSRERIFCNVSGTVSVMRTYLLLILGGVAGGLAISFPVCWPLVFAALLPLLACVYDTRIHVRTLFLHGWLFGSVFMGTVLYWFFNTLPLDWLGISHAAASVGIVGFLWGVTSLTLALTVAAWGVLVRMTVHRSLRDVVSLPILWVASEYLRMWVFALVMHNESIPFEPHFSFGFMGYALAHDELFVQGSAIAGVFGLSFFVIAVATMLYIWHMHGQVRRIGIAVALVCCLWVVPLHVPYATTSVPLVVETVTTNFASTLVSNVAERAARRDIITEQLHDIAQRSPYVDVIVLPESAHYTADLSVSEVQSMLRDIFGERDVLLVDSTYNSDGEAQYLHIIFISSSQGVIATQNKHFLLPVGEYMPTWVTYVLRIFGKQQQLERLQTHRSYTTSGIPEPIIFKGYSIGALACSEVVSPFLYRGLAADGANILINTSSHAWFHHGANPKNQLIAMAKVHAVWNKRPYVQASNAASSLYTMPSGDWGQMH